MQAYSDKSREPDPHALPNRVLVIRSEIDRGYGHIRGSVSHEHSDACGFRASLYGPDADICKVVINSQADDHSDSIYGFELAYDAYQSITMYDAQNAIATLKPILRKMEKMYAEEGSPATFGVFINRVARAVGAVKVITFDDARKRNSENGWRACSLGESVYVVDRMAQAMHDKLHGKLTA